MWILGILRYGLRRRSVKWYLTLQKFPKSCGFVQLFADPTWYVYTTGEEFVIDIVYMDDVWMAAVRNNSQDLDVNYFKASLKVWVEAKMTNLLVFF